MRCTARVGRATVKLCQRLEVGLLSNLSDDRARGVNAKYEWHMLDGTGGGNLAGLAVAPLFSSTLANEAGGVAVLGGLEFLNALDLWTSGSRVEGKKKTGEN